MIIGIFREFGVGLWMEVMDNGLFKGNLMGGDVENVMIMVEV